MKPTPPAATTRRFPVGTHHWSGWILVVVGLIVTALTPRLNSGFWHELGRGISDKTFSPYNIYLTLGLVALLYIAYAARSRASFLRVTVVMLTETGAYLVIKCVTWFGFHLFPRPSGHDGGFPSGHTAAVCALASLLTERWPKLAPLWYGTAALVGWARWASGAHYPYQVIAGAILGLTCGLLFAHRFPEPGVAAAAAADVTDVTD